jgi:hypothetical protein
MANTNEFLISELIRANTELGRNPKPSDLKSINGFPHYTTFIRRFNKTLDEILDDIGIYDGIDVNYWENIDSVVKAYYLGLFDADGCIYISKRGYLSFSISGTESVCNTYLTLLRKLAGINNGKVSIGNGEQNYQLQVHSNDSMHNIFNEGLR